MHHRCLHMTHAILLLILLYLLRGARCFHDLLCAARLSHIAENSIGEAGCIALSSSFPEGGDNVVTPCEGHNASLVLQVGEGESSPIDVESSRHKLDAYTC